MARRLVDIALSAAALVLLCPLMAIAVAGIRLSSKGSVLYRAQRVGINGRIFTMYKFRTMHVAQSASASPVTGRNDARVFTFGAWLRRMKIDELPQLFNILKGDMSIVGPRPEDPQIVERYFAVNHHETLRALPGLASPGSIYNYTHGETLLDRDDPERCYAERLLPVKLALDLVYVREASLAYDVRIILRTLWVTVSAAFGKRHFPEPPEMRKAKQLLYSDLQLRATNESVPPGGLS